ncbi:MAG: SRPBCC family protein [Bacteroidetes bacterium]|nr:SRPBCC family protein [Bacteroidota bacterium]
MACYVIDRTQRLPVTLQQAWTFFSSPENLQKITPPEMNFIITSGNGSEKTHSGQIITYKVSPLLGIRMFWMTEIKHVEEPHFFIDEQRKGPYALWHHKHYFKEIEGGVEMRDLVHYQLPLGFLGDIAHVLFVKKKLNQIFDHRFNQLEKLFGKL